MNNESTPAASGDAVERMQLPYTDEFLRAAILDTALGSRLRSENPVLWARAVYDFSSVGQGASAVTDTVMAEQLAKQQHNRYPDTNIWSSAVMQAVEKYLSKNEES